MSMGSRWLVRCFEWWRGSLCLVGVCEMILSSYKIPNSPSKPKSKIDELFTRNKQQTRSLSKVNNKPSLVYSLTCYIECICLPHHTRL